MLPFSSLYLGITAVLSAFTLASANTISVRQSPSTCGVEHAPAIVQPADGFDITSPTFTVIYCSGEYFKTSTIDASAWLTSPGASGGMLLVKDIAPNNEDAPAGYYSYRFNVTIPVIDGNYPSGAWTLSVYETTNGEF